MTPPALSLEDYGPIIGPATIAEIRELARRLEGRRLLMVNSTAVGGGVAELLNRLIPLLKDLGMSTRWEVLRGGEAFFGVTKAIHNALHGAPVALTRAMQDLFLEVVAQNAASIELDADLAVMHDPQPLALVAARPPGGGRWVWRCHVDVSHPQPDVWAFLRDYIVRYDASVFSAPEFSQVLPIPQYMIHPAIDPLAEKNRELSATEVEAVLAKLGIRDDRPIVTQVSRFDRLKDPVGVIRAYRLVRRTAECQLVLAGGGAADDPEGAVVLEEVRRAADGDPLIHILDLPPFSDREINALQRASAVVVQKSLREGFGLTVTEALWKKRPVVASAVGGIPLQVLHNLTGLLVHSVEGAAYRIRTLLREPDFARRLGENGHAYVKTRFLTTSNLRRWLALAHALQYPGERIIRLP
ncbi:MAG TPA: glycosyltransferase [Gemmatimonadales bacterium]|nr:glycosyltransferase [Gemmatimonadales bacterium]HSB70062.1 glycosyltransferase [Candidatus Methylomirabilis sp.]